MLMAQFVFGSFLAAFFCGEHKQWLVGDGITYQHYRQVHIPKLLNTTMAHPKRNDLFSQWISMDFPDCQYNTLEHLHQWQSVVGWFPQS
jgi:hypothetical protein